MTKKVDFKTLDLALVLYQQSTSLISALYWQLDQETPEHARLLLCVSMEKEVSALFVEQHLV